MARLEVRRPHGHEGSTRAADPGALQLRAATDRRAEGAVSQARGVGGRDLLDQAHGHPDEGAEPEERQSHRHRGEPQGLLENQHAHGPQRAVERSA
jgi:hypothetical protein